MNSDYMVIGESSQRGMLDATSDANSPSVNSDQVDISMLDEKGSIPWKHALIGALGIAIGSGAATGVIFYNVAKDSNVPNTNSIISSHSPAAVIGVSHEMSSMCLTPDCVEIAGSIISKMDVNTSVCSDPYEHFCGKWHRETDLPSDLTSIDASFTKMHLDTREKIKTMVETWKACPTQEINSSFSSTSGIDDYRTAAGCLYQSCMDTGAISKTSNASLKKFLESFVPRSLQCADSPSECISTWKKDIEKEDASKVLGRELGMANVGGIGTILAPYSHQHPYDSKQGAILHMAHSGLGLSYDIYTGTDVSSTSMRENYRLHIKNLLKMVDEHILQKPVHSDADYEARAQAVFNFEMKVHGFAYNPVESRDAAKTTNMVSIGEFKKTLLDKGGINLNSYLGAIDSEGVFPTDKKSRNLIFNDSASIVIDNPRFFSNIKTNILNFEDSNNENLVAFEDFILFRAVKKTLGSLGGVWTTELERHTAAMTGVASPPTRWKTCLSKVRSQLGWVVSHAFVIGDGEDDLKQAQLRRETAISILDDIRATFRKELNRIGTANDGADDEKSLFYGTALSWMDEETRDKALEKESKVKSRLGYPDWFESKKNTLQYFKEFYGGSRAILNAAANSEGSLLDMESVISHAGRRYGWSDMGKEADRNVWAMTPDEVNAYYMPSTNEIVFPDAILHPPFLHTPRSSGATEEETRAMTALNFGSFGAVAGHELTHAFDDQGSKLDGDGNLVDWWSTQARDGFGSAAKCMSSQFDSFIFPGINSPTLSSEVKVKKASSSSAEPLVNVNGELTLGENIADAGGVRLALLALHDRLHEENKNSNASETSEIDNVQLLPGIPHASASNLALTAFSQVWCSKMTAASSRVRAASDPHSPGPLRIVGTLMNVPGMKRTFECEEEKEEAFQFWTGLKGTTRTQEGKQNLSTFLPSHLSIHGGQSSSKDGSISSYSSCQVW